MIDLDTLNAMDQASFAAALDPVFENAPQVAQAAWLHRPFPTVTALHAALFAEVTAMPLEATIGFLLSHPDLAGAAARKRAMTEASIAEQGALGLDSLPEPEFQRFEALNAAYRTRFGFPFIVCVRRHTRRSILAEFTRRLGQDQATELQTALHEVFLITRLRLAGLVTGPGLPATSGHLSTHVLDNSIGGPAHGIAVTLHEMDGETARPLAASVTNSDGRTTALLEPGPLRIGTYELHFNVGAYFAPRPLPTPAFLDIVKLRFSIAEPEGRYHIPLLLTPWGYTTYRGS